MKLTNKYRLPVSLINFALSDKYDKGAADYSATGLIEPPRISALMRKHSADLEEDISDRVFAMLGAAFHHIVEQGADFDHVSEERLFAKYAVDDREYTISGQIDLQEVLPSGEVNVIDFKVCSVFAVSPQNSSSLDKWTKQLNIYADLLERNGRRVKALNVCAIIRDWHMGKAGGKAGYPESPVCMFTLPLWEKESRERYIVERIRAHEDAFRAVENGDEPSLCTDEERWAKSGIWACMRRTNKRASKVFESYNAAREYADKFNRKLSLRERAVNGMIVVHRKKYYARCETVCPVRNWCVQRAGEEVLDMIVSETHE